MSTVQPLEPGSRHDLRVGISPDAPDESQLKDEEGAFGYCHSYETSSRYDGPGLRVVLFVSGCLLRCTYCHNPDTWHLKDGTYVSADHVLRRLGDFAPSIRVLGGGTDHIGRRADGAACLYPADFRRCEGNGPAHGHPDLGISGRSCRRRLPVEHRPRPARHQEFGSRHLPASDRLATSRRRCASPSASLRYPSRSGSASRSFPARPTIPPMSTASPGSWRR